MLRPRLLILENRLRREQNMKQSRPIRLQNLRRTARSVSSIAVNPAVFARSGKPAMVSVARPQQDSSFSVAAPLQSSATVELSFLLIVERCHLQYLDSFRISPCYVHESLAASADTLPSNLRDTEPYCSTNATILSHTAGARNAAVIQHPYRMQDRLTFDLECCVYGA